MCIGFQVYLDAKAEADMEQTFRALQRHWEGAEFHHTRFIITLQQQQSPQQPSQNAPKHHIRDGGTFTIIGKLYTLPSIQLISTISTDRTVTCIYYIIFFFISFRFRDAFGSD